MVGPAAAWEAVWEVDGLAAVWEVAAAAGLTVTAAAGITEVWEV